ncbi:MAG: twin-arginine translocation signal domain-containing protein [Prolixibacteraceae bacterium]|nr:twin-arginine translocation signal domain-containing protein [Prolixibacteraceae bacterium]
MTNRRTFLKSLAGVTAGLTLANTALGSEKNK